VAAAKRFATAAALIAAGEQRTRTIEVAGLSVEIRSLTRGEVRSAMQLEDSDADAFALVHGVVKPALTEEQAKQMITDDKTVEASGPILVAIMELSGLGAGFRQG